MSKKDIVPYGGNNTLPELSRTALDCVPVPSHRPAEFFDIFRSPTDIVRRDTDYVVERGHYVDARINEVRKTTTLVQERINAAALIADIENRLIEIQRATDHERYRNESSRNAEKVRMAYDNRIAVEKKEAELIRAREGHIRAQRNCDAAERLAPAQVDEWYAQQEARKSAAFADRQDALADLARGSNSGVNPAAAADAAARQREHDLAAIEHEIELQRERGNAPAVLALSNLRARLRAA